MLHYVRHLVGVNRLVFNMTRFAGTKLESPALYRLGIPRPGIHVNVAVYLWSNYCGIGFEEIQSLRSYEIMELFWQYVRRFDDFVDRSPGMEQFASNPLIIKTEPVLCRVIAELINWLNFSSISLRIRLNLVQIILYYRRQAMLQACANSIRMHLSNRQSYETIVPLIETNSGLAGQSLAMILSAVHEVPKEVGEKIGHIFWYWAMAIQVADDIMDFHDDYLQNVQNLVTLVIQRYPQEDAIAKAAIGCRQRLTGRWLERNAPTTYREIVELFEKYISQMIHVDPTNKITLEMEILTRSIFTLSTLPGVLRLRSASIQLQRFLL